MKKVFTLTLLYMLALFAQAQMVHPVKFNTLLKTNSSAVAEIVFNGTINSGWHVYSTNLGNGGPISATFHVNKLNGVELVGQLTAHGQERSSYDPRFEMTLRYFEHQVTFVQKVRFTKPTYTIDAYLEYGACSDQSCTPPTSVDFRKSGHSPAIIDSKETSAITASPSQGKIQDAPLSTVKATNHTTTLADSTKQVAKVSPTPLSDHLKARWWQPVIQQLHQLGGSATWTDHSLLYLFFMGLVGGFLALAMPCIWPIIPMTVSFFLKRAKDDRRKGIRDAMAYGVAIIIIYLALGLLVTAAYGPSQLNALSTNAVFNLILFALLIIFAVSFFGWFELKLPDSWANHIDTKANEATGFVAIFLMAFTLVLVSFSCTAPIIGLLLVQTVTSGNWTAPAIGMLGFALALAIPFTLFALFPSLMKKSPRSGAWMNQVKVVLGFIELAFALKFFSVADLSYGWHLLDREVFLCLWIVIFFALAAYLIGWLKFRSDEIGNTLQRPMPVPAIMLGLCSAAFALYLVPGLWGAPCKAVSAFAPPMSTQDFNLYQHTVKARFTDFETGMATAMNEGKPVLIDFTGHGCVNCRKMEAAVWTDARVASLLDKDYILISLYVDDKTPLPHPITIREQGQQRTLRTVGDRWSYLQSHKFGSNAQPFYVALDTKGQPLTPAYGYNEDITAYINFLQSGLQRYQQIR